MGEDHGMKFILKSLLFFSFLIATSGPSAQPVFRESDEIGASGLPLPRFISISRDVANMRTGPGEQYPIDWVYARPLYPLEIIAEYDLWRQVRDIDGTEGWIHVTLLSGNRTVLITGGVHRLYRRPALDAPAVARLEAGVIGEILECQAAWCRLSAGGVKGWMPRQNIWGIYSGEIIN